MGWKLTFISNREMQFFLLGYIVIEICEIFTIGWFPLDGAVRRGFSAVHIAAIVATLWILMMNGAVGYQLVDDGTPLSIGLIFGSAAILFIGTGYIALDTGFSWTGYWDDTLTAPNRSYSLYTLYQLVPLVFLFVFFVLETVLVLKVLGEVKPMCKSLWHLTFLPHALTSPSLPYWRDTVLCSRPDFPICHQRAHLQWHEWQNQRRPFRDIFYPHSRGADLDILVEHNGG